MGIFAHNLQKDIFSGTKPAALIFILAFSLRLLFALFSPDAALGGDAQLYEHFASSLAEGRGLVNQAGGPSAFYPPAYPLFLALLRVVFGKGYLYYKIAQGLVGAITCVLIYLMAKTLFNRPIGLIAGIISSLYHFFIVSNMLMMSETLFTLFLTLTIWFWIRARNGQKSRDAILLGVCLSLGALTKAAFFYFFFLILAIELIQAGRAQRFSPRFSKAILLYICSFALLISVWVIRNYSLFGKCIYGSTQTGIVLYSAYHPKDEKIFGVNADDKVFRQAAKINSEIESNEFLIAQTFKAVRNAPAKLYRYLLLKAMNFWSIFDWEILGEGRYNFSTAFILPFSFLGLLALRKGFWTGPFLIAPLSYYFAIALVVEGLPRFRLPVEPFLIILASYIIYNLTSKCGKPKSFSLLGAWLLLNLSLYFNSAAVKQAAKTAMQHLGLW